MYANQAPMGQPPPEDPVGDEIRRQAIDRLIQMNGAHALMAWERRNTDPIAGHALALFYLNPQLPLRPNPVVQAATRLWLAGPESTNLAVMLNDFVGLTTNRANADEDLDPRKDLATYMDPGMLPSASYIGLGLSTLDTHTGSWEEVMREVTSALDVPGRCYLYLADRSRVIVDRRARPDVNRVDFYSTHTRGGYETSRRRWFVLPQTLDPQQPDTLIWELLVDLHDVFRKVDARGRHRV